MVLNVSKCKWAIRWGCWPSWHSWPESFLGDPCWLVVSGLISFIVLSAAHARTFSNGTPQAGYAAAGAEAICGALSLSLSVCFSKRIMDAGWFCWMISLNTTGTRTIFSTRAYTKWYKHSLHIPEMPTIAHLCEFHDLPSWMLGHSAATCCNFEIFQNDLEDFKTIRTCSSFENALGILWHPTTCEVQGPLTPASLDKRPVETGLAVEQPRMAPTKPLIRKTLAEDDTDTTDDTVDSSTS